MEPFACEVWPKPSQVEGTGDVASGCWSPPASQGLVELGEDPVPTSLSFARDGGARRGPCLVFLPTAECTVGLQ